MKPTKAQLNALRVIAMGKVPIGSARANAGGAIHRMLARMCEADTPLIVGECFRSSRHGNMYWHGPWKLTEAGKTTLKAYLERIYR